MRFSLCSSSIKWLQSDVLRQQRRASTETSGTTLPVTPRHNTSKHPPTPQKKTSFINFSKFSHPSTSSLFHKDFTATILPASGPSHEGFMRQSSDPSSKVASMSYAETHCTRCILYIYSTNIGTEYFKHGIYSFFPLQNAVCFIILTYLVPVLFTFYIQGVLKLKKNNSGAKRLRTLLMVVIGLQRKR